MARSQDAEQRILNGKSQMEDGRTRCFSIRHFPFDMGRTFSSACESAPAGLPDSSGPEQSVRAQVLHGPGPILDSDLRELSLLLNPQLMY